MWNSENFIKDFLKANNLDIFSRDCDLSIGKRIKKVLGISALGLGAFLFPGLALTIGGGALLYAFHKFKYHQVDNIKADEIEDLSDELDINDLEEAREMKREQEERIAKLKKDLKKTKFRRSLFLESDDVSFLSSVLAVGACIFTPVAIPFVVGSSILHGFLSHKELKYSQKRTDLQEQIKAEEKINKLLGRKITFLEAEANNQDDNTLDDDNTNDNENTNDIEDTNDIDNTIDDDIQFDPAQVNNNNDDNMDNTNDLDNAQDLDEQVPVTDEVEEDENTDDSIEEFVPIRDDDLDIVDNADEVVVNDNQRHVVSNTDDSVNPVRNNNIDNINNNVDYTGINPSSIRSDDRYQVPTYNPLYEKAVDLYLDSLTVDNGRNNDSRIEEVINKVYSK